jgi:cytochrome P450
MTDTAAHAAPSVFDAPLHFHDVLSPAYQDDWHGMNRRALASGPIAMGPFGPAVLGYGAVHDVLRDRRYRMPPGMALEIQGITSGPVWDRATSSLLSLDGDEHHRLRRLVAKAFTPQAAERLRASMATVIEELVGSVVERGAADVVTEIARPYPIAVICELLGAPRDDWERFSTWTDDIFKIFGMNVADDGPAILQAFDELDAYIDVMVEDRRQCLTDDLVSHLIRAEDDGDRLSHEELRMLVGSVLTGGTDTTRNQLAAAVDVFCDHPDQWELLGSRPEMASGAVDEVTRHSPVIIGTARLATVDTELCGFTIPAGSFVDIYTAAANRDPSVFDDPDTFDITRTGAPPALTFGGGIHYCLGVHLAKAELEQALTTMARRMPTLRRDGAAPWKPVLGITGPSTLPVRFDPGR